jgi:hypothetical protein
MAVVGGIDLAEMNMTGGLIDVQVRKLGMGNYYFG